MKLLPRDSARRNAVLLAFLAVAGVYFVYTYLYSPRLEGTRNLEARLHGLAEQTRGGAPDSGRDREDVERVLTAYEELVKQLETLIPAEDEVPALIEAIATEQGRAGVEMTMLRPEPSESYEYYERRSYRLAVSGSYHAIGSFITAIGSLERAVATDEMIVAAEGVSPTAESAGSVTVVASFRIHFPVSGALKADSLARK